MIRSFVRLYFCSWWLPSVCFFTLLAGTILTGMTDLPAMAVVSQILFWLGAISLLGILVASIANLVQKRWLSGLVNLLTFLLLGVAAFFILSFFFLIAAMMFGPSEDGFADDLTIPEGIEIAEPEQESSFSGDSEQGTDAWQLRVREVLSVPGQGNPSFSPDMPSLRKAATHHGREFRAYIEASPDWHVFKEQGNHFAAKRWSYGGEPRNELHGYISDFFTDEPLQTRCLICLDRKQWSRYRVQQVKEGRKQVRPQMASGNSLHESRVMIDCGGVWVEIFEQSKHPERRVTKATITELEQEFAAFLKDKDLALSNARARSNELAKKMAGEDGQPFRLLDGMQPGIYGVVYALNPGEPGYVYLKAYEFTKGTALSAERLKASSETRMTWSRDAQERFGAKAGFTIYEGDWDKPYAARFEVWFRPDSGKPERKLAERVYKIEGWQR